MLETSTQGKEQLEPGSLLGRGETWSGPRRRGKAPKCEVVNRSRGRLSRGRGGRAAGRELIPVTVKGPKGRPFLLSRGQAGSGPGRPLRTGGGAICGRDGLVLREANAHPLRCWSSGPTENRVGLETAEQHAFAAEARVRDNGAGCSLQPSEGVSRARVRARPGRRGLDDAAAHARVRARPGPSMQPQTGSVS